MSKSEALEMMSRTIGALQARVASGESTSTDRLKLEEMTELRAKVRRAS